MFSTRIDYGEFQCSKKGIPISIHKNSLSCPAMMRKPTSTRVLCSACTHVLRSRPSSNNKVCQNYIHFASDGLPLWENFHRMEQDTNGFPFFLLATERTANLTSSSSSEKKKKE
ncbi:hypothetical protein CEXT_214931 [Caerostris extrusa]|uniref:Uncharacterized protein n=1 Tax=Caerostris extrusa TaxID=172846 RepID=A0AAV4M400_CAEEX|nr:hypothetical protein CEXT_214931 [Caerostris extrusa]